MKGDGFCSLMPGEDFLFATDKKAFSPPLSISSKTCMRRGKEVDGGREGGALTPVEKAGAKAG